MHAEGSGTVNDECLFLGPNSKQRSDNGTEYVRLLKTQGSYRHCGQQKNKLLHWRDLQDTGEFQDTCTTTKRQNTGPLSKTPNLVT